MGSLPRGAAGFAGNEVRWRRTDRRQPTARPMQTPPYSKTGAQITGRKDVMPEVLAVVTRSWEAEGMSNRAPHANTRIRAPITEVLRQQFCRRCGYRWLPRQVSSPVRCPACKSPYWHRPRKPNRQAQEAAGTALGALAAMPVVQAGAQVLSGCPRGHEDDEASRQELGRDRRGDRKPV